MSSRQGHIEPPTGACVNYWSTPDMASYCKKRMLPEPDADLGKWTKKELLPYAAMYDTGMPRELFQAAYGEVGKASDLNLEPMRALARDQYGLQVDERATKAQVLESIIREVTKRLQPAAPRTAISAQAFKNDPSHFIFHPPQQGLSSPFDITNADAAAVQPARRATSMFDMPPTAPTTSASDPTADLSSPSAPGELGSLSTPPSGRRTRQGHTGADVSPRVSDVAEVPSVDSTPDLTRSRSFPNIQEATAGGGWARPRPPRRRDRDPKSLVSFVQENPSRAQELLVDFVEVIDTKYPDVAAILMGDGGGQNAEEAMQVLLQGMTDVNERALMMKTHAADARQTALDQLDVLSKIIRDADRVSRTMDDVVSKMRRLGVTIPGDDGEASDGAEDEGAGLKGGGPAYYGDAIET